MSKTSKFGFGLLIGTALGAAAAFFLSPKSGKQNRDEVKKKLDEMKTFIDDNEIEKNVKEIFGTVTEESRKTYEMVRKESMGHMKEISRTLQEVDVEGYKKVINNVIEDVKKNGAKAESVEKAKKYMMNFINDLVDEISKTDKAKAVKATAKKVEDKVTKK